MTRLYEKKFNVLGHELVLTSEDCLTFDNLYYSLFEKASPELRELLDTIPENELIFVLSDVIRSAHLNLINVQNLLPTARLALKSPDMKATFTVLGCQIELAACECRERDTLIASLYDKASPELKEKLVQSDEDEVHLAITGLIDDAYLAFNSPFLWSYKHMKIELY